LNRGMALSEVFAHADHLGALTGEQQGGFAHRAETVSTNRRERKSE
jgi:hypothetical protein